MSHPSSVAPISSGGTESLPAPCGDGIERRRGAGTWRPQCLDMWETDGARGWECIHSVTLYMSEELADKTWWAGPAPTFPPLWHPQAPSPRTSPLNAQPTLSWDRRPLLVSARSGSRRPREPEMGQERETAEVTLSMSCEILCSRGHQRLPCPVLHC